MSWNDRFLGPEDLRSHLKGNTDESLPARVGALLAHQKETWPALREGYDALSRIETKRLEFDGSTVVVQHNPGRIRSTAAAVDATSVQARRCFLCGENLPDEEKGIPYLDDLVILCNPFPVLDRHLVIAHRDHVDQRIEGRVATLLMLARDLGDDYFVLYNGPECGASAPDHFHLQALSRAGLPIVETLAENEPSPEHDCDICSDFTKGQFELFTLGDAGRSVIVFRGGSLVELTLWVERVIAALAQATTSPESRKEPKLNLVGYCERGVWTVLLFPRARHRPTCFFAEEPDRMLVSPGAVDMAGVVVVPEHSHFERLGAREVEAIFTEVSLELAVVEGILEAVCGNG